MYNNYMYHRLYESSSYDAAYSNEDAIEKLGEVDIFDPKTKEYIKMNPSEIIKVCNDARYKIQRDYPYLYQFMTKCKIMYIPVYPSNITNTMAVDDYNNMWINLSFVYGECKMMSDRIFGILFHELFHIFFDHCLRFNKLYPKEMFAGVDSAYRTANMKSNICMDYEVNSSMVEDGIVSADFWKNMNGLYKKEYKGMAWEDILRKYGDKEYQDWMERNGMLLNELETKILEAIEKAAKTLLDPEADEDDKKYARRELQRTLDDLLGKKDKGEKTLQDMFEDLSESKLGDVSSLAMELEELADDMYKDPSDMSGEELDKTLNDMRKLADDIMENADEIGKDFDKSGEDVQKDVAKAKEAFDEAMKKINEGGLSKEEKQDLIDEAKDALEDVISNEVEKEKNKKKREERDAKKKAERLEKLKKTHPLRRIITIMNNFRDLHEMAVTEGDGMVKVHKGTLSLISDDTDKILEDCINDLEPLTEKKFGEMKKSDLKSLSKNLDRLKDSFLPDLTALIDNDTILNKTPEDMQRLLDGVFENVFNAFRRIFDTTIDDDAKASLIKVAAEKMRIIGKVLKTQKVWKVGDDFKDAYISEMKRLMDIFKKDGEEGLMRELIDKDALDVTHLDAKSRELYDSIMGDDSRKTEVDDESGDSDVDEHDIDEGTFRDDDDIDAFKGDVYYDVVKPSDDEFTSIVLSPEDDYVSDDYDTYSQLAKRFELDFPEYDLFESAEAFFDVVKHKTDESADADELEEKLSKMSGYKSGKWKED